MLCVINTPLKIPYHWYILFDSHLLLFTDLLSVRNFIFVYLLISCGFIIYDGFFKKVVDGLAQSFGDGVPVGGIYLFIHRKLYFINYNIY